MDIIKSKIVNRLDCDLKFGSVECHSVVKGLFGNFDADYVDFAFVIDSIYLFLADKVINDFERALKGFEIMKLDHEVAKKFINDYFKERTFTSTLLTDDENSFIKKYQQLLNYEIADSFITLSTKGLTNFKNRYVNHQGVKYSVYTTRSLDSWQDFGYWVDVKGNLKDNLKALITVKIFNLKNFEIEEYRFDDDVIHLEEILLGEPKIIDFSTLENGRFGVISYNGPSELIIQFRVDFV